MEEVKKEILEQSEKNTTEMTIQVEIDGNLVKKIIATAVQDVNSIHPELEADQRRHLTEQIVEKYAMMFKELAESQPPTIIHISLKEKTSDGKETTHKIE